LLQRGCGSEAPVAQSKFLDLLQSLQFSNFDGGEYWITYPTPTLSHDYALAAAKKKRFFENLDSVLFRQKITSTT